ncbi:hypothetical protein N6L26_01710 [Qipengyuania sp. SS22]|uniref:hypothetical protein n=1 Tax=Qipengyuania sp. SS22 TaxID=2979461 RepID=UPI0021E5378E|nr:hypothetical protein [Qipengyuania sp. SS22]UYH55309.1 hypothetical protein N6L26_01710 [Qipengyuania sp. SS22]
MKLADRLSNLFRASRRKQDPAPANDALPWVGSDPEIDRQIAEWHALIERGDPAAGATGTDQPRK